MNASYRRRTGLPLDETTLIQAVGRGCGYLLDAPLDKYMANQRLRARAVSSSGPVLPNEATMRHPMGQVRRIRSTSRLLLPRTSFRTEGDAESVCARTVQILTQIPESHTIKSEACGIFEELLTNAIQHGSPNSDPSSCICHAVIEYSIYRNRRVLTIGVYDDGIGIQTLRRNAFAADEHVMLLDAVGLGTTGTEQVRGVGLFHAKEVVNDFNGCMYIASGRSHVFTGGESYIMFESSYRMQGWLVIATLCA